MSKFSLAWHESCLANMQNFLHDSRLALVTAQDRVARLERNIIFYEEQIKRAKAENRDSFDREKFNHKRKNYESRTGK